MYNFTGVTVSQRQLRKPTGRCDLGHAYTLDIQGMCNNITGPVHPQPQVPHCSGGVEILLPPTQMVERKYLSPKNQVIRPLQK